MKFKVGEIYKDRSGAEYTFVTHAYHNMSHAQLIFIADGVAHYRHVDGKLRVSHEHENDISPPERKTVKLYPALHRPGDGHWFCSGRLYAECPDDAIRLVTEYGPVIVEVDE